MQIIKPKICYILPKFDLETDTHYFYLYDFINQVAKDTDLVLLIEDKKSDANFFTEVSNVYIQKFHHGFLRWLENFYFILKIRLRGYKNFYVHYSYISAFNAGLIARVSGARTFYWSCGMMWLFGKKGLLKLVLHMVSYLVTGARSLIDGYSSEYNLATNKIKIMPNWIDLQRFSNFNLDNIYQKYNLERDKDYVLFVHRLAERKGAHYIAKIASTFADRKNVKFLIAGDGPYKDTLAKEIKNLDNVILLGKVPNRDVPAIMKIAKLFFMPSEEEGFPRVLLEAMAAYLPYVAFDIGGVKEISSFDQQEYIVPLKSVSTMIEKINVLLDNESLRLNLAELNYQHVKKFDILKVKEIFIGLFN